MTLGPLDIADLVVFTTREHATLAGTAVATASRRLGRAAEAGLVTKITRGVWANTRHPHFHPLVCVPAILGNEQGYVSFLTALHLHDVISQIPRTVQVATTGRGRVLRTPVATYEMFQLAPAMMRTGVEWSDTHIPYRLATAEKALVDVLYLSTRKGRRFRSLPELDLSRVRRREVRGLLAEMENRTLAAAVRTRAAGLGVPGA